MAKPVSDRYAINPTNITDYSRDQVQLETFWAFCVIVAGRNADMAARKVGELFTAAKRRDLTPFSYLDSLEADSFPHAVHNALVASRIGQYRRITAAFEHTLWQLRRDPTWLSTASVDQLMRCPGVGPKTARFFVLHSRRDAQVAVLDVHVLRWLREEHGCDAPTSTPPKDLYDYWEDMALAFMRDVFPGLTPAQADLMVWAMMSGRLGTATGE